MPRAGQTCQWRLRQQRAAVQRCGEVDVRARSLPARRAGATVPGDRAVERHAATVPPERYMRLPAGFVSQFTHIGHRTLWTFRMTTQLSIATFLLIASFRRIVDMHSVLCHQRWIRHATILTYQPT